MTSARAILLEVGGLGMIREILFKQDYIQDARRASILVDELNGIIWVWIGTDVNIKTRKQLPQVAEKIQAEGYLAKTDGHMVGQNCSQIIYLDQRELNNQNYQKALNIFNLNYVQDGRFVVQFEVSPTMTVTQKKDPRENALAGILIASILQTNPEIFIGRTSLGVYNIETSQGTLKFQISNGNIQLLPGSAGITEEIQREFQESLKVLK
jgi:hypothetical protein